MTTNWRALALGLALGGSLGCQSAASDVVLGDDEEEDGRASISRGPDVDLDGAVDRLRAGLVLVELELGAPLVAGPEIRESAGGGLLRTPSQIAQVVEDSVVAVGAAPAIDRVLLPILQEAVFESAEGERFRASADQVEWPELDRAPPHWALAYEADGDWVVSATFRELADGTLTDGTRSALPSDLLAEAQRAE